MTAIGRIPGRVVAPPVSTRPRGRRPDVAGFAAAQRALREYLGVDAAFLVAGLASYPPGTPTDPETGKPYDPFLEASSATADETVVVRCSFVSRPLVAAEAASTPIGALDVGTAALVLDGDDYPSVRDAHRVDVNDELYAISQFRMDIIAGYTRYIAELEHA